MPQYNLELFRRVEIVPVRGSKSVHDDNYREAAKKIIAAYSNAGTEFAARRERIRWHIEPDCDFTITWNLREAALRVSGLRVKLNELAIATNVEPATME